MKRTSYAIVLALILLPLMLGTIMAVSTTLSWQAPTTNEDGSPLTDLAGYTIRWGMNAGGPYPNIVDVGMILSADIDVGSQDGTTVYYVATAYDTSGNQSAFSNEVSKTYPTLAPSPPVLNTP